MIFRYNLGTLNASPHRVKTKHSSRTFRLCGGEMEHPGCIAGQWRGGKIGVVQPGIVEGAARETSQGTRAWTLTGMLHVIVEVSLLGCVFSTRFGLCTSYIFLLLFAKFCWLNLRHSAVGCCGSSRSFFLHLDATFLQTGSRFGTPTGRLGIAETVARGYRAFPHRQIYYFTPCLLLLVYNFNRAPATQAWSWALGKLLWENAFASQRNRLASRGRGFGMPAGCFNFAWCRRAILSFRVDAGST